MVMMMKARWTVAIMATMVSGWLAAGDVSGWGWFLFLAFIAVAGMD